MGNRARGKATFLNFPWKTSGVLPLYPPWPCLLHVELVVWFWGGALAHFRGTFCVRAAQAPSQKCHCTTGSEISWCLSSGSQPKPLFSSRQTLGFAGDSAGLQSGICPFSELERDANSHSASLKCIWKTFYV